MAPALSEVHIRVPATSANLGPGFDTFGMALDRYSDFQIRFEEGKRGDLFDFEGNALAIAEKDNLIWKGYRYALEKQGINETPGFIVHARMELPTSRGFGSSASALAAGVHLAARHTIAMGSQFSLEDELAMLNELEGHPDNVFPARIGGWVFGYRGSGGRMKAIKRDVPENLGLAIIVPPFTVSTVASRRSLPDSFPIESVKSNITGACLWMEYLRTANEELLIEAIHSDRIHEDHRKDAIPGYDEIHEAFQKDGAYGITLSGSGPGILVYYNRKQRDTILPRLQSSLAIVEQKYGQSYPLQSCGLDATGLTYLLR